MIARHALFSFSSSMSACEVLAHTGAGYSKIQWHRDSAGVPVVHSSWYSVCAASSSTSCQKLQLSIWVAPCSLDQLYSMTLSVISLLHCAIEETP